MKLMPDLFLWVKPVIGIYIIYLAKLQYFTNLDFPKQRGFPLLNHHLGEIGRVRPRANLTRYMGVEPKIMGVYPPNHP